MNVSELVGSELDFWVARALGAKDVRIEDWGGFHKVCVTGHNAFEPVPFLPSSKWSDGGPIIEREKIRIEPIHKLKGGEFVHWNAKALLYVYYMEGPTALKAAMRCFVASRFGEDVQE